MAAAHFICADSLRADYGAGPGSRGHANGRFSLCAVRRVVFNAQMELLRSDLGWLRAGTPVQVALSAAANVRLIDAESAVFHQLGMPYFFLGGLATRSPVKFRVPADDQWFVVVDLEGLIGSVSAKVRVLRRYLPPISARVGPPPTQDARRRTSR